MRNFSKFLSAIFFITTSFTVAYAADKIPVDESLGSANSWQKEYELTEDMKGKYNVLVTATDSAGNITQSDAFNIYIDLESDMPKVGVTNPSVNQIVQGNLNIVGTASDDDDVAKVTLIFDGDTENPVTATGTRFWSYNLSTLDLEEGNHTMDVFATDINGLDGHTTTVKWTLDRRTPALEITNHTMGEIVHDKVTLEGKVSDGNNIASLEYSFDGGRSYKPVSVKTKTESDFKIAIDTRKFEDGPAICYLRATDKVGSYSTTVFFFYVDNSNPEVRIIAPEEGDSRNGRFVVTGYAKDAVGLKSLKWKFANQTGEVELVPGSNYWAVEIDATGLNGKQNFEITATDSVDNVVSVKQPIVIDAAGDVPVANITYFNRDFLRGYAKDDDGIASVSYVFDKDEEVTIESNGVFVVPFDTTRELEFGRHTITVYATDIYGTKSKVVSSSFNIEKPKEVKKPAPKKGEEVVEEEPEPVNEAPVFEVTGPEAGLWITTGYTVTGTVSDDAGLDNLELAYCVDDELTNWIPFKADASGKFTLNIDVSDNTTYPDGYIPITLRAAEIPVVVYDEVTGVETVKPSNTTLWLSAVKKDVTAPVVSRVLPEPGISVNGKFLVLFDVQDNNQITKIEYVNANGKSTVLDDSLNALRNPYLLIGTEEFPYNTAMRFVFTDINGNSSTFSSWSNVYYDAQSDKPIVSFNVPEDNQLITTDFTVSGIATDDDGDCLIYYSVDGGAYKLCSPDYTSSYNFTLPITMFTDNEHTISVYAEDLNGLKGDVVTRNIRVSLEEPAGSMNLPLITDCVRNDVTLSGVSSDKNGISLVQVSLDNGITYNNATGTTTWSYTFDSKLIQDGTHAVFIKVFDGYGIETMFSSMVTIDNNKPTIILDYPLDGTTITKSLNVVGRVTDTIGLSQIYLTFKGFNGSTVPSALSRINLNPDASIVSQLIDLSSLSDGDYNVELVAIDRASNETRISRNFTMNKNAIVSKVDVLFPLPDSYLNHRFNIYGTAIYQNEEVAGVDLYIDGKLCTAVDRATTIADGYYKFIVDGDAAELTDGKHSFHIVEISETGKTVSSKEQSFIYGSAGPWVTLDNFVYGDFAIERPFLRGEAGYALTEEEALDKKIVKAKTVTKVMLSLDNGKTFTDVTDGKGKWKYRVENLDIPAGCHYVLVKAVMADESEVVTRMLFQVDRTAPSVEIITPVEGNHYNQTISYSGIASDDVYLQNVEIMLRKGDKNSYQLPSFIQGLYLDTSFWGASLYSVGVGLTAFDGAVKVQGQWGQYTKQQWDAVQAAFNLNKTAFRFGGNIFGGKIIAQLLDVPFMSFLGRDFEWLSATGAIGANFSYFTESGAGQGQMLSAVLLQAEFPKVTLKKNKAFKTWALYYEPQLWFISSDVASSDVPKFVFQQSIGLRASIF